MLSDSCEEAKSENFSEEQIIAWHRVLVKKIGPRPASHMSHFLGSEARSNSITSGTADASILRATSGIPCGLLPLSSLVSRALAVPLAMGMQAIT
jgi:hypothetical protein